MVALFDVILTLFVMWHSLTWIVALFAVYCGTLWRGLWHSLTWIVALFDVDCGTLWSGLWRSDSLQLSGPAFLLSF